MKKQIIFPIILSIIIGFRIAAQVQPPRDYVISNWNLDDGLPQSTVNEVIQARDGYIWLATWGGLVRFDGVKFTVFDRSNSPGMVNDRVIGLFEDKDGAIWISTEKGLSVYKQGSFRDLSQSQGFPDAVSINVRQDKNGGIWLFTPDSIYKFINNRCIKQQIIYNSVLKQKALNGEGDFWTVYLKNIVRLIDGNLVYSINMTEYTKSTIWDVIEDKNGTLWVATNGDGIFKFVNNKTIHYTKENGLFSDRIRRFLLDKNGDVWAIGIGGISRISTGSHDKIYSVTRKDGLSDSDVICFMQDSEKNYWAGTVTGGLNKLRKAVITVYGENQGLFNDKLLSLCFKKNGTLLIGTNCDGIYELINGRISFSSINKYLNNTCVWSIFEDSYKRIWISARDLILIDKQQVSYFNQENGLNGTAFAIYEDRNRTVWFGCGNGLYYFSKNKLSKYSGELSSNDVRSIFEDRDGNLWVGTTNGLNKISGDKIEKFISIPGLASNYIRAIHQDEEGTLWFGSYGGGLIRFRNNKFKTFTVKDGLFDNIVSHIIEDDYGYFWMGSNRGIARVKRQDLNDYADLKQKNIHVTSFGKQDGMVSVETNGGFQPSAVKDINGKIYFPSVQGLVLVNPAEININSGVPPVHIEKFFAAGREITTALQKTAYIPYDSTDIQIQYTALSFIDNKKIKFKYKIDGYDDDWIDAGTRRSAYYTKLPPGEYVFRVIASNNDGMWNQKGTSVSFVILPPFWMTWWFRSIIILLFLSAGPLIYYRRVSVLKREKARQEEFSWMLIKKQEEERSRIAQELHDSLGQEMLMIKNRALLGIKNTEEFTKPRQQLEYISASATSVISLVRQISHNLRPPELDRLGLTETLRSILSEVNDSGEININSNIDNIDGLIVKENEINIVRILQEALSNILKHSGASELAIKIKHINDHINLMISDNGKGFSTGNIAAGSNGNRGLGLTGMSERVHILGGDFHIDSAPAEGTRINIFIPAQSKVIK